MSTVGLLASPQLRVTLVHRASHFLYSRRRFLLAQAAAWFNLYVHKAALSPASCIGGGLYLACPVGLIFHGRAGSGLNLYTHSVCFAEDMALLGSRERAPRLGNGVSIGTHAAVLGDCVLGDGVRVAFGVAVAQEVPAHRTVVSKGMLARTRSAERARGEERAR